MPASQLTGYTALSVDDCIEEKSDLRPSLLPGKATDGELMSVSH